MCYKFSQEKHTHKNQLHVYKSEEGREREKAVSFLIASEELNYLRKKYLEVGTLDKRGRVSEEGGGQGFAAEIM